MHYGRNDKLFIRRMGKNIIMKEIELLEKYYDASDKNWINVPVGMMDKLQEKLEFGSVSGDLDTSKKWAVVDNRHFFMKDFDIYRILYTKKQSLVPPSLRVLPSSSIMSGGKFAVNSSGILFRIGDTVMHTDEGVITATKIDSFYNKENNTVRASLTNGYHSDIDFLILVEDKSLLELFQGEIEKPEIRSKGVALVYHAACLVAEAKKLSEEVHPSRGLSEGEYMLGLRGVAEEKLGEVVWHVASLGKELGLTLEDIVRSCYSNPR